MLKIQSCTYEQFGEDSLLKMHVFCVKLNVEEKSTVILDVIMFKRCDLKGRPFIIFYVL